MEASPSFATKQAVRLLFACLFLATTFASAQDWVRTGTNLGAQKIRLAAADFKMVGNDPALSTAQLTFNQVLFSDLNNAGIFDMVSKSMAPAVSPGSPSEINLTQWNSPPANAAMVAFGAIGVQNGQVIVSGWLFDAKNTQSPQVLGQRYAEALTPDTARHIAHEFADAIIRVSAAASTKSRKARSITSPTAAARKRSGRWTTTEPTSTR